MMKYRFSDLVDISDLQQILVSFHTASGIRTAILDLDNQIIVASSAEDITEDVQQFRPSQRYDEAQVDSLHPDKSLRRYSYYGGLFKYIQTLRIDNREIATLILGPILHELPNEDTFHQLAQESGFDGIAYVKSVKSIWIFWLRLFGIC
jgi:hypothetical protein